MEGKGPQYPVYPVYESIISDARVFCTFTFVLQTWNIKQLPYAIDVQYTAHCSMHSEVQLCAHEFNGRTGSPVCRKKKDRLGQYRHQSLL
jgi:hypothetical protein